MKSSYDPSADHRPKDRWKLQLTRELKVERKAPSHPSIGGSKGYDSWYRRQQMEKHQNGESVNLISQRLEKLQIINKKPSIEAFKAYSPANMRREFLFWNRQLPIGVVPGNIESTQVRTVGNYEKGQQLAVMIAVEPGDLELPADMTGNIVWPWRWVDLPINLNANPPTGRGPLGPPGAEISPVAVAELHPGAKFHPDNA
eukprot:jgi/Psemu1/2155/gm1.2155_g